MFLRRSSTTAAWSAPASLAAQLADDTLIIVTKPGTDANSLKADLFSKAMPPL
jgi:hypothetical protein